MLAAVKSSTTGLQCVQIAMARQPAFTIRSSACIHSVSIIIISGFCAFLLFLSYLLVAYNEHSRNISSIPDLIVFTIICVLSFNLFVMQGGYVHEISAL